MLRLATHDDIPQLTTALLNLKAQTAWKDEPLEQNPQRVAEFVTGQLTSPESVCYVWDDPAHGFCGVRFAWMHLPPHLPYVFEWGWDGSPRAAVRCWRACCEWGKKRGAVYGLRTTSTPGSRVTERCTWERL